MKPRRSNRGAGFASASKNGQRQAGRRLHIEALEDRRLLAAAAFAEMSASLGLDGLLGISGDFHAGGLTFTDLTNDGYADLYLIGPSNRGNRLYVNVDDGSGGRTFEQVDGNGGTSYTAGDSSGSVAADYDNDGDLDIYLTNLGDVPPKGVVGADNILFKNMWMEDHPSGTGDPLSLRFVDVTASTDPTPTDPTGDIQHGLGRAEFHNPDPFFTTTLLNHTLAAAWADVNRDGWVDIYVGSWDGTNDNPPESHDGFLGERDTLYLNNGDGTFTDVTMSPDGSVPTALISDGSFEVSTHNSQTSNSAWTLTGPSDTALFWGESGSTFAASSGQNGVWFRGFAGNPVNPIDANATQVVVAPEDGDYTLQFDARVEQNFANVASDFRVTVTSDGTGGSDTTGNLLTLAPDFDFNTYTLTLTGVTAGDNLTIVAEMLDADGSTPPALVDDGSFEMATAGGQTSNSDWVMTTQSNSAQFQQDTWAASDGAIGVWFQGFHGTPANPVDAQVTQVVTAAGAGDYTLSFDAKVEENFASVINGFQVTITSDGTGGSATIDLLAAAPDFQFNTYTLNLSGVSAGDNLTIVAEMIGAMGQNTGQQRSGMVDAFRFTGGSGMVDAFRFANPDDWQQVGGWEYADGSFNDPSRPAEFSGHNGLQFADFNNDGWQDLIVATMGGQFGGERSRDMLYLNRGLDGSGDWLGYDMVSYDLGFGGIEPSNMGVTVGDIDNDGDLDYFSTLLPAAHPIWINNLAETGTFGFTRTTINNDFAWGANFHDFDNNGRLDLLVGTEIDRPSFLHLQEDNGVMTEQAATAGLTSQYSTRGVAVADYNRDGWSDTAMWLWSGSVNPGIQFYQNNSAAQNANFHFLTLELEGDPTLPGQFKSTRDAIGARAYVTADFDGSGVVDADETRMEEVLSGHSQASTTSSLSLEFGIGQATSADVRIVWGSGRETLLTGVGADQFLAVKEQTFDGDFDTDGDIDGADFIAWQRGFGTPAHTANKVDGDGDGDKDVDSNDLTVWQTTFGSAPVSAASSLSLASTGSVASAVAEHTNNLTQQSMPSPPATASSETVPTELNAELVDLAMAVDLVSASTSASTRSHSAIIQVSEIDAEQVRAISFADFGVVPRQHADGFDDLAIWSSSKSGLTEYDFELADDLVVSEL